MKEKMHTGDLYLPNDPEIATEQQKCLELLYDFNHTRPSEGEKRAALMKEMFAEVGEGCYIEPPFYANWSGKHVHMGNFVYFNFNATMVDDTHIYIGDYTMLGPNVTITTAGHPILPELREKYINTTCQFTSDEIAGLVLTLQFFQACPSVIIQ